MTILEPRGRYFSISVLLALIPLVFLVLLVRRCYVDVPIGDEWEIVPRLLRLHTGTFSFLDLWGQHNEHRPMFGIATVLMLVEATHWNVGAEVAANVVVGTMIFGVCAMSVRAGWPAGQRLPVWLLPVISFFVFSPSQSENWLWGWQVTIFLNVLAVVAGFALLARLDGRWGRLAGAMLCGIVATYSFASGLVFWVVGFGAWILGRGPRKRSQIAAWVIVAALTIASYFYDYHANPGHPTVQSNFVSLDAFVQYLVYCAKYTGAAVAGYDPEWVAAVGCAGAVSFIFLAVSTRKLFGTPIFAFAVLLAVDALAVAMMTGLGRSGFGADQGLSSRYISVSTPLWLAIFVLAGLWIVQLREARETNGWWRVQTGIVAVALAAVVLSAGEAAYNGVQWAGARRGFLEPARSALVAGTDDQLLLRLYPSAAAVRIRRETLIDWHLSVFRSARAQRVDSTENR